MIPSIKTISVLTLGTVLTLGLASNANAAAFITNGTIQLGVDDFGQLNVVGGTPSSGGVTTVGLRYLPTNAEATAAGCLCEGWGVADATSGITGYANNNSGSGGLSLLSFTSTADTATSVVDVSGLFKVTHNYAPSANTANLYETTVTIENISANTVNNLLYRRVIDWDIEPTAFNEYVTIAGTTGATNVAFASDDGFASSNPLNGASSILFTGDAVDSGPDDHGALFDFDFGQLEAGKTFQFTTFYGAAANESDALAALGSVGAEVYSLGQSSVAGGETIGEPNTFIFGFAGVGGTPVPPSEPVPEPASMLGILAFGALGGKKLLKRKQKQA